MGSHTLDIIYDNQGNPYCCIYDGTLYLYVLNLQGDVIRLVSTTGATAASYVYDAWGNVISSSGSMAEINPIRYRGYYYDTETGLYYLGSRYYDPQVKRFVNADAVDYLAADGTFLSYNMFIYCKNNPVIGSDPTGQFLLSTALIVGAVAGGVIGAALGGTISYNSAQHSGAAGWELAGKTALGAITGGAIGATIGAAVGYGVGYLAGGTYANGLVAKSVTSSVKSFVSQANKVHHVLGKSSHNLNGFTTKAMEKLMKKTLAKGVVSTYKTVKSAYWGTKKSEVTFTIIKGVIKISDMWIR